MATDEDNNIESIVAEAVKAKVGTMMIEAMGDPGVLVQRIVSEALTMSIKNRDYPYKAEPVIHTIVREAVVEEAKTVMRAWVDEQRPAIRKELAKRIQADRDSLAAAMIDSLAKKAGNEYGWKVIFEDRTPD